MSCMAFWDCSAHRPRKIHNRYPALRTCRSTVSAGLYQRQGTRAGWCATPAHPCNYLRAKYDAHFLGSSMWRTRPHGHQQSLLLCMYVVPAGSVEFPARTHMQFGSIRKASCRHPGGIRAASSRHPCGILAWQLPGGGRWGCRGGWADGPLS